MTTESPLLTRADKPGKRISFALAISVHLLLAAFLFYGVRWQTKATNVVEVELVLATPEPAVVAPPAPVAVPPAPTVEPPPPPPKPEIAIKDKEKPKPLPKVEPKPPVNPFQEQLKRELEQTTQRTQADRAEKELSQVKAAQAKAARDKATAAYVDSIVRSIRPKIVVPPEVKGHPEAVFDVTQLPTGDIVTVRLKRSSGHAALDVNIERAIHRSNPLPRPQSADLFERDLVLRFKPLDD